MPGPTPAVRREVVAVKIGLIAVGVGLVLFLIAAVFPGLAPPLDHTLGHVVALLIPGGQR
jgi:hypothetical protein